MITRTDTSAAAGSPIPAPCVVKAIDSGSSIDVYLCHTQAQADEACAKVLASHGRALVEKMIRGTELTVGILEERPLAPIRIVTTRDFYDFEAKYRGNFTEYHFDLNLPAAVVDAVKSLALRAHQTVGARDLSRVDIMLDEANRPYLLEINTLPGFTPKSLLPKAANHEGIAFGPLVDRLVRRAAARAPGAAAA